MISTGKAIQDIRHGGIQATLWENIKGDKMYYSFTIKRNYKPRDSDEWKTTNSFSLRDIENIMLCLAEIQPLIKVAVAKAKGELDPKPVEGTTEQKTIEDKNLEGKKTKK